MTFLRLHISIFKIQIIFSCFIQDLKLVLIMNLRNIFQHFNDYFTIFNPKDKKKYDTAQASLQSKIYISEW